MFRSGVASWRDPSTFRIQGIAIYELMPELGRKISEKKSMVQMGQ